MLHVIFFLIIANSMRQRKPAAASQTAFLLEKEENFVPHNFFSTAQDRHAIPNQFFLK